MEWFRDTSVIHIVHTLIIILCPIYFLTSCTASVPVGQNEAVVPQKKGVALISRGMVFDKLAEDV